MALSALAAAPDGDVESHEDVVKWYRRELAKPAVVPWKGARFQPQTMGPSWEIEGRGSRARWVLPEHSIGWDLLGFCGTWLQLRRGEPWRFTLEQARLLLWWYAVDEDGRWIYRDGVLQRLKGWGKDPFGACLAVGEMVGPARFCDFEKGEPFGTPTENAWVQTAAVSLEQTKNTMKVFPWLLTDESRSHFGLQVGKEIVHGLGDTAQIQAVTSSPKTLEGARSTFVLRNETHHWLESNEGHEMAAVIERNGTKSADGAARALAITNAFNPSEDSSAQHDRDAFELAASGGSLTTGILYDSLEADPEAPLTAETAPDVVASIRGDSHWLDVDRIVKSILDTRNPPSRSRRFWYNQIHAAEDAWADPIRFDSLKDETIVAGPDDEIVVFFDGSKSDDTTGIVGCRVNDGHVITLGMWQKPPGDRGNAWTAPRDKIDAEVEQIFEHLNVVAFWADPSHAKDDETDEAYWDDLIDTWHRRYGDRLQRWAVKGKHAVMWDMTSPERTRAFTKAAQQTTQAIDDGELSHDGDSRLRRHVHNARRRPNRYGVSLGKEHRESQRKIDLAVCMVGARLLRRELLNDPDRQKRRRTGRVY